MVIANSIDYISNIPIDLQKHILSYLNLREGYGLLLTSERFSQLALERFSQDLSNRSSKGRDLSPISEVRLKEFYLSCIEGSLHDEGLGLSDNQVEQGILYASLFGHLGKITMIWYVHKQYHYNKKPLKQTIDHSNALELAVKYNHTELVKTLIEPHVYLSWNDDGTDCRESVEEPPFVKNRLNAFRAACFNGKLDMIDLFLKNSRFNSKEMKELVFTLCEDDKYAPVVERFLKNIQIQSQNYLSTAFLIAAKKGAEKIVEKFLELQQPCDDTMIKAIEQCHKNVRLKLLERSKKRKELFFDACSAGDTGLVKEILQKGISISLQEISNALSTATAEEVTKELSKIAILLPKESDQRLEQFEQDSTKAVKDFNLKRMPTDDHPLKNMPITDF